MHLTRWFLLGALVGTLSACWQPPEDRHDGTGRARDQYAEARIADDYFSAGASAGPPAPVEGDAFVTGGEVVVRSEVDGDAVLSGGSVQVTARIGSDLYAAGGRVLLDAAVGHNARLAGGRVDVTRHADVAGKMTVVGSAVRIEGSTGGALAVFGERVVIDSTVGGGVAVVARELEIGPRARIDGRLTYRTAMAPRISQQAVISGGVHRTEAEFPQAGFEPVARVAVWVGMAMLAGGLFLVGAMLLLLAPHGAGALSRKLRQRPAASFLLGFASLVCIPLAAALAMITVIGIPIGLVLLFLYPLVLVFGYVTGAIFCGDALAALLAKPSGAKAGRALRLIGLAVVLIVLMVLSRQFMIGVAMILLLLFSGTGALFLGIRSALR